MSDDASRSQPGQVVLDSIRRKANPFSEHSLSQFRLSLEQGQDAFSGSFLGSFLGGFLVGQHFPATGLGRSDMSDDASRSQPGQVVLDSIRRKANPFSRAFAESVPAQP